MNPKEHAQIISESKDHVELQVEYIKNDQFQVKDTQILQKSTTIIDKLYNKPENTLVVLLEPNQESREETHPAGIGIETSLGALRI